MPDTREVVWRYVELTNEPGSPSFELFGEQVGWLEFTAAVPVGSRRCSPP